MRKFICSDFEIDLSVLQITDTAENPWFNGNYFSKYSYPFNLPLTDELDIALGHLSNFNSADSKTLFEGVYVHGEVMEKAILEIEECEQELSATIRYGLDDFPNFKKKLAELQLIRMDVPDIYTHAAGVIAQAWPAVNYNFPQVHTDKIEPEDNEVWFAFEKIINNYKNGAFLVNDVDTETGTTFNRNIMQPLPYLLYLLKAGVEDAGYTLHGDLLEHPTLKKVLVYADVEYFQNISQESLTFLLLAEDYDSATDEKTHVEGQQYRLRMAREVAIAQPGKYRIQGSFRLRRIVLGLPTRFRIYYRNTKIYEVIYSFPFDAASFFDYDFDFEFETVADGNDDFLLFSITTGYNEANADDILVNADINPVYLFNESGQVIPSILNPNKIVLNRAVPDIEFGSLFKFVLDLFKFNLDIIDRQVWVNSVANEMASRPVIDLSGFEVKFPKRPFSRGNSFLLRYQDPGTEDYTFAEVFQDASGTATTGFVKDDEKTTETEINALPLPLLFRNNVQTVHAFSEDAGKPYLVLYDGLSNNLNLAKDPAELQIPYIHERHHYNWNLARINGTSVTWTFLAYEEQIRGLNHKSRVHAYRRLHQVKALQKTQVSPGLYEVEIQTEII